MLEAAVENRLIKRVKEAGGLCFKVVPTTAGLPDRLVALNGRLYLVELKRPKGGRLRPVQVVMHERLAKIGIEVALLYTLEAVDDWVRDLTSS